MKTKLTAEIIQTSYCVPLSEKQWKSLNAINDRSDDRWDEVNGKLTKAGAFHLEYNGHFGRNFFFAIRTGTPLSPILRVLERIVNKPLRSK